jgi:hypothetical protein
MLTPQRKTAGIERIPSAYGVRVPPVIESFIRLMVEQVRDDAHELFEDAAERKLLEKLRIEKVSREVFAEYTAEKQVSPPQVKTCQETNRVYLAGTGRPGRDTYVQEEVPIPDEELDDDIRDRVRSKVVTREKKEDSLLLAFSEITWQEFQEATLKFERLPDAVVYHFTNFFDTSPENCPNLMLAGQFSEEDIVRIARSARYHTQR